jgi:hypothetical protein
MSAADSSLPLRSLLFAPGNEPRKVQKVATFGSDAIILDLYRSGLGLSRAELDGLRARGVV